MLVAYRSKDIRGCVDNASLTLFNASDVVSLEDDHDDCLFMVCWNQMSLCRRERCEIRSITNERHTQKFNIESTLAMTDSGAEAFAERRKVHRSR